MTFQEAKEYLKPFEFKTYVNELANSIRCEWTKPCSLEQGGRKLMAFGLISFVNRSIKADLHIYPNYLFEGAQAEVLMCISRIEEEKKKRLGDGEVVDYNSFSTRGTVNRVDGDVATVSIFNRVGEEAIVIFTTKELSDSGVYEGDDFTLEYTYHEDEECYTSEIKPIPRKELSHEEVVQIWTEANKLSRDLG